MKSETNFWYGMATISRLLKNIGLFCKRALQKRPIFCNETYILKENTNRSHPISNPVIFTGYQRFIVSPLNFEVTL